MKKKGGGTESPENLPQISEEDLQLAVASLNAFKEYNGSYTLAETSLTSSVVEGTTEGNGQLTNDTIMAKNSTNGEFIASTNMVGTGVYSSISTSSLFYHTPFNEGSFVEYVKSNSRKMKDVRSNKNDASFYFDAPAEVFAQGLKIDFGILVTKTTVKDFGDYIQGVLLAKMETFNFTNVKTSSVVNVVEGIMVFTFTTNANLNVSGMNGTGKFITEIKINNDGLLQEFNQDIVVNVNYGGMNQTARSVSSDKVFYTYDVSKVSSYIPSAEELENWGK